MKISMIAAIGKNRELGKNNDLIWHFKEDMQFFKQTTMGSAVIMGRKTFESLPAALPNRKNIVLSTDTTYHAQGAQTVADIPQALAAAENTDVFIIGGASVYEAFLPYAETIYLTEIDAACEDADTFFPPFDTSLYDKEVLQSLVCKGIKLQFVKYSKKDIT
ncbi:MAG: dihydrofolate reductase [Clostridia bacterium]|nr:dihydrofolate reductase [Clostridia bacterium]